ncbi:hypothetical protein HFO56_02075 [Rhizobium laguerreae]|uniref:hypothetical protein n=1 Tax=Rhizobium laguerreae TaxID=1076926 RepID=UPI001C8FD21D|nr:hypothetical protein [Rhizobium laguerreae]MBY3151194.1 hypothetical protein [Rhizobium laguerreae]
MAALEVGLVATFVWTCFSVWIAYTGPSIANRSVGHRETGWSRDTLTLYQESQIRSLLLYTLAFHVAIWAAFWIVRRLRSRAQTASDMASFVLAALLTLFYIPAFVASLVFDSTLFALLWPNGFATFASHLAYLDASDRPFVYASVVVKLVAIVPAALCYAAACFTRKAIADQG